MSARAKIEWRIAEAAIVLLYSTLIALFLRWLWPDAPWYAWLLVWLFATKWTLTIVFDVLTLGGGS